MTYTSSITTKYGDTNHVKADASRVFDILDRQGADFIIDTLAEYVGTIANKCKMPDHERQRLISAYTAGIRESLLERL